MPTKVLKTDYEDLWQELLLEAEASGEPQRAAFFTIYSSLAAENGDCADLNYAPVYKGGLRGYQVDGYSFDQETDELHLAICDFRDDRQKTESLNADQMNALFRRVIRFCENSFKADFITQLEETSAEFEVGFLLHEHRNEIVRIRCLVFSNAKLATRKKFVESAKVNGIDISFNVFDFVRYIDVLEAQGAVEEVELDIEAINGAPLPCVPAHIDGSGYESYLVVFPGSLIAEIYALYGPRLMEQNVRTFLQARTKVNKGIINTVVKEPENFFAFNNGLTVTASDVTLKDNEHSLCKISNLQIVNGGQTTASILYANDKLKADLSKVFVQVKLSVINEALVDELVPQISRFSNDQNRISSSDLFSNHPFLIEMQQISRRLAAPMAEGALAPTRWYFERARGQYRNETTRSTPAEKRNFERAFPRAQVIQKTDFAKYYLTFEALPHTVSLGAQKLFNAFAVDVDKRWESDRTEFGDDFFKQNVAKAIIFRWLDKAVAQTDWYKADRGYKANIVTYAIAWLVNNLEGKQLSVDLDGIWRSQSVPGDLQISLLAAAESVAEYIKSPQGGSRNPSEYAKTQACWFRIKEMDLEIVGSSEFTIDRGESTQRRKETRAKGKIDLEIEIDTLAVRLQPKVAEVRAYAEEHNLLSPKSNRALEKIQKGSYSFTKTDRNSLRNLFSRLDELGIDVSRL